MRPPGYAVLGVARRLCSTRVLDSLVTPALADLQHEYRDAAARGRWARGHVLARGYASLLAALAIDLGALPGRHVRENWIGGQAPGWQLVRPVVPRVAAVVVGLTTLQLIDSFRRTSRVYSINDPAVLLQLSLGSLPSVLLFTVPMAFLFGLVLALRRLGARSSAAKAWTAPATGLSCAVAAAVFVLCAWIVPVANNAAREILIRELVPHWDGVPRVKVPRDTRAAAAGLTFPELTARISDARREGVAPAALVVEWHTRLVIPLFCVFLGPLAVGLASRWTRRLRTAAPIGVAILVVTAFYCTAGFGGQAARNGRVSPVLGAWAAAAISPLAALFALARRRAGSSPSPSPS